MFGRISASKSDNGGAAPFDLAQSPFRPELVCERKGRAEIVEADGHSLACLVDDMDETIPAGELQRTLKQQGHNATLLDSRMIAWEPVNENRKVAVNTVISKALHA